MSGPNIDENSPEIELISYCMNPLPDSILGGTPYGNKVIKVSSQAVIKFGFGVTEAEAFNQSGVHKLVDPQVVRIPKVHRYFSASEGRGYIVMDFIEGKVIEPLEDPKKVMKIARIVDHLASFDREVPGPLHHGPPAALLFLDEAEYSFDGVDDLEAWWNRRLLPGDPSLCLQNFELVLCHLDIAPRNILWEDGQPPCMIDWASAGYYPRFFEFCAQRMIEGKEGQFNTLLLNAMTKLERVQFLQITPLLRAWSNIQRYYL